MESITPRIKRSCFSFILDHPSNNIGKCMVENTRRYRLPKSRLPRCSHQNNSQCCCIVGNASTSALTSPRCAALLHVGVCQMHFWLDKCPPLLTISATNGLHRRIFWPCKPCHSAILRWSISLGRHVCRTTNGSATITEESIDDRHHSSPQHTAHLPLLCRGLHLFLSSPCTLPVSGAT
jgi:hypothetical protein